MSYKKFAKRPTKTEKNTFFVKATLLQRNEELEGNQRCNNVAS